MNVKVGIEGSTRYLGYKKQSRILSTVCWELTIITNS